MEYAIIVMVLTILSIMVWRKFGISNALFYVFGAVSITAVVFALIAYDRYVIGKENEERQQNNNLSSEESRVNESDYFIFIGEPISIEETYNENNESAIIYNDRFDVVYKVLQPVWGNYDNKKIAFSVYDHYGWPVFLARKYSLIFVRKNEDGWIHEKYQFYPVNPTSDGKWAYCGDPTPSNWQGTPVVMSDIKFSPPVVESISQFTESYISRNYSPSIWGREGDFVNCKSGVYPEELIRLKMEGVLKARGLF
ncbi:hypothetical protein QWI17_01395 [Gilvimarinus sp. SDUM040013]|uniref:Uncharacterized protein n=1 Tax=Gilvimarinus gilvus TaxID=3058038 RepID=A0ABU4S2M9_9GAMM|nr:hypothetical protein [Gilvimarinus sp. SDUM040013]MDO3384486.1 hypothetical protein [Gilvimarinus sp. SDUM040013]MDX6850727.1 hypothetical protein [Gilvimarinus sp. SDUM040013]